MLVEYKKVRQEPGGRKRRWFESDDLELVVWYSDEGEVEGFQLLYRTKDEERALTWRPGEGFVHSLVDEGNETPLKNLTPILVPDGAIPWARLTGLFAAGSAEIEPGIRKLVLGRMEARR